MNPEANREIITTSGSRLGQRSSVGREYTKVNVLVYTSAIAINTEKLKQNKCVSEGDEVAGGSLVGSAC